MPVTDPKLRAKLIELGYDPDASQLSAEVPAPQPQTRPEQSPTNEPTVSNVGSTLRSFGRGILPTAGALGTAAMVGKGISMIPHPIPKVAGLGIQLGAAALGGIATRKLQDEVVVPALGENVKQTYDQYQQADRTQNPLPSTLGEIFAAGPFLAPTLKTLPGAARAIYNPLRGAPAQADDVGNLLNVGLGATVPTAMRAVTDPNVTGGELVAEALGGALFSDPTKMLGQRLGLKPNTYRQMPMEGDIRSDLRTGNEVKPAQYPVRGLLENANRPFQQPNSELTGRKLLPEKAESLQTTPDQILSQAEERISSIEQRIEKLKDISYPPYDPTKVRVKHPSPASITASQIKNQDMDAIPPKYSQESLDSIVAERQRPTMDKLYELGLPTRPTEEYAGRFKKLGEQRNVRVDDSRRVFAQDGSEVMGQALPRVGTSTADVKVNPKTATLSDYPHELQHHARDDRRNLGTASDKRFESRSDSIVELSDDYAKWKTARDAEGLESGADEYIAVLGGEDTVRRVLNLDGGNFKNWLRDFKSNIKMKFGGGDTSDVARMQSNRLINDPPFAERYAGDVSQVKPVATTEETKNSEEGVRKAVPGGLGATLEGVGSNQQGYIKWLQEVKGLSEDDAIKHVEKEIFSKNSQEGLTPESKPSPVTYRGAMENPKTGYKLHLYDLNEDIKDPKTGEMLHPKGSTVSEATLTKYGLKVPEGMPKNQSVGDTQKITEPPKNSQESLGQRIAKVAKSFTPEIDKIRDLKSPEADTVATAASDFYDDIKFKRGELVNDFSNKLREATDLDGLINTIAKSGVKAYAKQTTPELESAWSKMGDLRDGNTSVKFTPAEQNIRNIIKASLDKVRQEVRNRPTLPHTPGANDPNYVPHVTKWDVLKDIMNHPLTAETARLKNEFINYQAGKLRNRGVGAAQAQLEAQKNLEDLLAGYNSKDIKTASQFGPVDKAEGLGLPKSWREENPLMAMERYLDRVARRLSYHDTIETKPGALDAIEKLKTTAPVKTVMDDIQGARTATSDPRTMAAMGIVRAANLGTLTGARDFGASFTLGFQHMQNPLQAAKAAWDGVTNLKQGLADAYKTGRVRAQMNDLEWSDSVSTMRRVRDIISDVQGRNWLEQMTRANVMNMGKSITLNYHAQHRAGKLSKAGQEWFNNFGKGTQWQNKNLTKDDLLKISARYVDSNQGSYDYTGLPKFAVEGHWAPVFALAKWNIEKANNFNKYVVKPAMKGNVRPLLMSTLGMMMGGAAVTELTEFMTGRKEKTPQIKELAAAHKQGEDIGMAATYKFLGLASNSGFAGMYMDIAKGVVDKVYGKNKPRWYNNILLDVAASNASMAMDFANAVRENGLDSEMAIDGLMGIIENNFQAGRLIMGKLSEEKKEQIDDSNNQRDLRVFKTIRGEPITDYSGSEFSRKFGNDDVETFKETKDVGEAAKLLPKLIDEAWENSKKNGKLDPEKLRSELSKLKRNSYQTMPNPKTMPASFLSYLKFLELSQGKEVAQQRLSDYLEQNAVNKLKAEAVPNL